MGNKEEQTKSTKSSLQAPQAKAKRIVSFHAICSLDVNKLSPITMSSLTIMSLAVLSEQVKACHFTKPIWHQRCRTRWFVMRGWMVLMPSSTAQQDFANVGPRYTIMDTHTQTHTCTRIQWQQNITVSPIPLFTTSFHTRIRIHNRYTRVRKPLPHPPYSKATVHIRQIKINKEQTNKHVQTPTHWHQQTHWHTCLHSKRMNARSLWHLHLIRTWHVAFRRNPKLIIAVGI